jgi:WD40 repeat protein
MILDPRHDRERFRVEAEAAASLNHPNIVAIHEVGEFEGYPYFSMQFVDGGSLSDRLADGPLSAREAAELTATIARAVHFAHQRGILHRDLKPANVLLDTQGRAFISDFGLAKQTQVDVEITQSGAILGTPGYMAPEQASGRVKNLTVATDVYGLGAVLYAALIGRPPFCGDTGLETLRLVTDRTPRPVRAERAAVSRDLETICLKCLEKTSQARYASAEAVADDLERFLRREPIKARPIGPLARVGRWCGRNPAIASLTAAVVVLLIGATVVSSLLALGYKAAREAADVALADYYTTHGVAAAHEENPHEAVLWFAAAAELARSDPERVRENLIHLNSARKQVLEPAAVLWLENASISQVQFSADSTHLLCVAGPKSVVWNLHTDERWQLFELLPEVRCASISRTGNLVAVGGHDGRVTIADLGTRQILHHLEFARPIQQVAFSDDGRMLAVAEGKSVHVWYCRPMQRVGAPLEHPHKVLRITFDRRGERVVTVCRTADPRRGEVRLFRMGSADPEFAPIVCVVETDSENRTAFWPAFTVQDQRLLVKHLDGPTYVRLYDAATGQVQGMHHVGVSNALVVAPDGRKYLNCGRNYARISEVKDDGPVRQKERLEHREQVIAADFSSDGKLVATGGWDRDVRLWRAQEGAPRGIVDNDTRTALAVLAHQTRVSHVAFSPNSRLLATVQIDGMIRVSKIPEFNDADSPLVVAGGTRLMLVPPMAQSALLPAAIQQNSRQDNDSVNWLFAVKGTSLKSASNSRLTVHRVLDRRRVGPEIGVDGILMDVAFSPAGGRVATINAPRDRNPGDPKATTMFRDDGSAGALQFWTWPDGCRQHASIPMPAEPRSVAYRPDGLQVAVMCAMGQVLLVDTQSGSVTCALETGSRKLAAKSPDDHGRVCYSPEGRSLIAWAHGVWVWDAATGHLRYSSVENAKPHGVSVDVSADGRLLAVSGGQSCVVRVFELESGKLLGEPIKHADTVFAAAFSPDGRRLVTACRDGQARVFDWRTGQVVLRGLSHERDVLHAVFTPDGRHILTVGLDRTLRTWNADNGRPAMSPRRISFHDREILITPDSRYALVAGVAGELHVVDLGPLYEKPESDVQQAKLLGELLSNQTIHDGGTVKLTTSEWLAQWRRFSE